MRSNKIVRFSRYVMFALLTLVLIAPQAIHAQESGPTGTAAEARAESVPRAQLEPMPGPETPPDEVTIEQTDDPNVIRTSRRIYVSEDSYLSSGFPNSNFGGSGDLYLGWQNGNQDAMRILIKFDIGAIPNNAIVHSAQVHIYQDLIVPNNDGNMDFKSQYMRQDWGEGSVTWNNANYLGGDQLPFGSFPNRFGYLSGDATNMVKSWVSGQHPNYGLLITGDETPSRDRSRRFQSRETGNPPYIDVEYDVHCDTIAPDATVEPLSAFEPGLFLVKWHGEDHAPAHCSPSGIANYDVQYRINGGSWVHWKDKTQSTENHFKNYAPNGAFVELTARATDHAGNVGSYPGTQASTTIDAQAPTTAMTPLPEHTLGNNFTINWSGNDGNGSGVQSYNVQFRANGGNWQTLLSNTQQTSYHATGVQNESTYDFRVQATDQVGNVSSWPANPQASTTVYSAPVARVLPFNPSVLKSTAPVTDRFTVYWSGTTPPGTSITQYEIYYQYNGGEWQVWKTFPGTQTSDDFLYQQLGYTDGLFTFNAKATNDQGLSGEFVAFAAGMAVDLADEIQPSRYLPVVVNGAIE